jgi:hypothetical protein
MLRSVARSGYGPTVVLTLTVVAILIWIRYEHRPRPRQPESAPARPVDWIEVGRAGPVSWDEILRDTKVDTGGVVSPGEMRRGIVLLLAPRDKILVAQKLLTKMASKRKYNICITVANK